MKSNENGIAKFIKWFVFLQPLLDILTSVMVRYWETSLTVGMIVRILFVCFIAIYLFFIYDCKFKKTFRIFFAVVCAYGVASIGISAYYNGVHTIVENGKMFFKMYYFIFVLLFFFAVYLKERFIIKDWHLAVVFICYTCSIFISAVTDTSFVTYKYGEGFCGWFYAGNEVGAVVSILAMVAFMVSMNSKNILLKIAVSFLMSFAAVYIGTKVPFLSCIGAVIVSSVMLCASAIIHKDKNCLKQLVYPLCTILLIAVLFQLNSPMKKNGSEMIGEQFNSQVSDKIETGENKPGINEIETDQYIKYKAFLLANWVLSNRLIIVQPAIIAHSESPIALKLFGMGYGFNTDYGKYNELIEMDFIALVINHGLIGTLIYLLPIIVFAVLCIKMLFKNIKSFFEMFKEVSYIYSVFIALGCAFLAGHVLVAPSVSIYLAIIIVNLYASLKEKTDGLKLQENNGADNLYNGE